jgi:hypothetical protein
VHELLTGQWQHCDLKGLSCGVLGVLQSIYGFRGAAPGVFDLYKVNKAAVLFFS